MPGNIERVLIIGLDCAEPSLVFDLWRGYLPNLRRLMEQGAWTTMNSTTPPITIPAWSCMMTSKDPGTLGIYGFRNRKDFTYAGLSFATSTAVKEPRLWDILGQAGKSSILLGVPGTYPVSPVNGAMVGCFLTPDPATNNYTYPASLRDEIDGVLGKNQYRVDVSNYRTENKADLLREIYEMTDRRFALAKHWIQTKPWDFFMLVEMGIDRVHHAFWRYFDPQHRKYEPGSPYAHAIRDYYLHVDQLIGELLDRLRPGPRLSSFPTTAANASTAASRSTSGSSGKVISRWPNTRNSQRRWACSRWTGQKPRFGAKAVITRASSSTARAASPKASSPPASTNRCETSSFLSLKPWAMRRAGP